MLNMKENALPNVSGKKEVSYLECVVEEGEWLGENGNDLPNGKAAEKDALPDKNGIKMTSLLARLLKKRLAWRE